MLLPVSSKQLLGCLVQGDQIERILAIWENFGHRLFFISWVY
jgi:hypothetical protein